MTGTRQQAARKASPAAADRTFAVAVNGAERMVPAGSSIGQLLASLAIDPRGVVVEHNARILRDRDTLPSVILAQGDVVEIVHFVGGG